MARSKKARQRKASALNQLPAHSSVSRPQRKINGPQAQQTGVVLHNTTLFQAGGTLDTTELMEPTSRLRERSSSMSSSDGGVPLEAQGQEAQYDDAIEKLSSDEDSDDSDIIRDYMENIESDQLEAIQSLQISFATSALETPQDEMIPTRYNRQQRPQKHQAQSPKSRKLLDASVLSISEQLSFTAINVNTDFDVTDFERPSLQRRKKKGDIPSFAKVSDEDLQATMQSTWARDREKKVARKRAREELRQQGLLPSQQSPTDLRARYPTVMRLSEIKAEVEDFMDGETESLMFPPMDPMARKIIHEIAHELGLKSKSHGNGQNRCPVLTKKSRTIGFDETVFLRREKKVRRTVFHRTDISVPKASSKKSSQGYKSAAPKPGEFVGQDASELGVSKGSAKAKALMEKMGWKSGEGLGSDTNRGIVEPIQHIVRYSRAGLG